MYSGNPNSWLQTHNIDKLYGLYQKLLYYPTICFAYFKVSCTSSKNYSRAFSFIYVTVCKQVIYGAVLDALRDCNLNNNILKSIE